jgi:ribonuclease HI
MTIADLNDDEKLNIPPGDWTNNINNVPNGSSSQYMIHKNKQLLAVLDESKKKWHQHFFNHSERAKLYFESSSVEMPNIDSTEYTATNVIQRKDFYTVNPRLTQLEQRTKYEKSNSPVTIGQRLCQFNDWTRDITANLIMYDEKIWHQSQDKQITIATDAGVRKNTGGFGVVFECENQIIMECFNRLPQIFNDLHSYRSEEVGILCGLILMSQIQNIQLNNNQKTPSVVTVICDNEAMIKAVSRYRYKNITPRMSYQPEMDVIREIIATIRQIEQQNTLVKLQHVKGHQDRTSEMLSKEAKLNIRADELATKAQHMKKISNLRTPTTKATLSINGELVTSAQSASLRKIYHSIQMRKFLEESNKWKGKTIDTIWWKVHGPSIEAMRSEKTTIQKFIHGRLPCNQRNNLYYPYKPSYCSTCSTDTVEDQMHFIICKCCPERQTRREQFIKELKNQLVSVGTHETTTRFLMYNITSIINDKPIIDLGEIAPDASKFFLATNLEQSKIGWDQILKGRLSIKWGELYNYDIKHNKLKITLNDAEQRGKKITVFVWRFVIDMWRIRNEQEHNLDGKKLEIAKTKETEQIMWLIKEIKTFEEQHPYMNITKEKLKNHPLSNIQNMNEQLQTLYDSVKAKHISRTGKKKISQRTEYAGESDQYETTTNSEIKLPRIKHTKKQKKAKTSKKEETKSITRTSRIPLSQTVQAISHVSTHIGGPRLGEG